jgi:tripartite-type tricarboxylate transporter receptor subunit TctC
MAKDLVALLNGEISRILFLPDVKSRMDALAVEVARSTPEELGELTRRDADRWGRTIRELGITAQ